MELVVTFLGSGTISSITTGIHPCIASALFDLEGLPSSITISANENGDLRGPAINIDLGPTLYFLSLSVIIVAVPVVLWLKRERSAISGSPRNDIALVVTSCSVELFPNPTCVDSNGSVSASCYVG